MFINYFFGCFTKKPKKLLHKTIIFENSNIEENSIIKHLYRNSIDEPNPNNYIKISNIDYNIYINNIDKLSNTINEQSCNNNMYVERNRRNNALFLSYASDINYDKNILSRNSLSNNFKYIENPKIKNINKSFKLFNFYNNCKFITKKNIKYYIVENLNYVIILQPKVYTIDNNYYRLINLLIYDEELIINSLCLRFIKIENIYNKYIYIFAMCTVSGHFVYINTNCCNIDI